MTESKFHSAAAEQAAADILAAFEHPEDLPAKLAHIALAAGGRHVDGYSWGNQLLVALRGYTDAAGFKQWLTFGRCVERGQKAFPILAPIKRQFTATDVDPDTGKETKRRVSYIVGWRDVGVFGLEQTKVINEEKWEAYQGRAADAQRVIERTPFFDAAVRMGFTVHADGRLLDCGAAGCYMPGFDAITLAVENLLVAAHELAHGVDDKLGTLTRRYGQQPDNEIVAELAGSIILQTMGLKGDADLGACYQYIKHYAQGDVIQAAAKLLNRTMAVVQVILQTIEDPDASLPWEGQEAAQDCA